MKKTILLFGASSFVGSNLIEQLRNDYRIIGTYHKTQVSFPGVTCIPCDILKKDLVSNIVARFRPDVTIFAAGMSSLRECQIHPKQADALNSAGAINCCAAAERYDSKFVFLSSCFVLGGDNILYREGETPFPATAYGTSLASTEFYVQRSCLNYLILRCSPLYGRSFNPSKLTWFEHLQMALAKGEVFPADDSVKTGFLDIQIMARILKASLDKNVTNRLFHVSSSDFMSRYEFGRLYAKIFKKDENLVQRVNGKFPNDKPKASSAEDSSNWSFRLDASNIEEFLTTKMPKIEDSLNLSWRRLSSTILAG